MDLQKKYGVLLKELEGFFVDDVVAITHDNWELYHKLLEKKHRHLKAARQLAPKVNQQLEAARVARIKELALESYNLLEKKYAERKAEYARLEKTKLKIKNVRKLLKAGSVRQTGTQYA